MTSAPIVHALLIGIDAYPPASNVRSLHGAVNDVTAIERWLRACGGLDDARVTKLIAPQVAGAQAPTRVNILAALDRLAADNVGPGEHVFIAFSGHGARRRVNEQGAAMTREALLTAEHDAVGFVWDFEVNARLAKIAARRAVVTVFIDCCHSAGTFRGDEGDTRDRLVKSLEGVVTA